MARARNIKPSFFKNETLAELPPLTRLLFIGLWTLADRAGRLEDRPKRIKAELFPYEDFDVDFGLNDLDKLGFIARYKVEESAYIQIVTFDKHQSPHLKEPASTIPAPDKHCASTSPAAPFPLSLNPITLSFNPEPGAKIDNAENEKTKPNSEPKKNTPPGSAPPPPQYSHAKIETMEQAIVAASKWLDEHEQQKQFWISTARFSGDISQEVAKFHSHYWRESGQHHKCKTDPIRFFQDGFLGWLINSKEFNRSQQGPSEAAKPQRATIVDYKPGRAALFEKQKF